MGFKERVDMGSKAENKTLKTKFAEFKELMRIYVPEEQGAFSFLKHAVLFLYHKKKYLCMKNEYFAYRLFEKDPNVKKEYVPSLFYYSQYVKRLNSDEACSITVSKPKINSLFPEFTHRDWVNCVTCSLDDLQAFLDKHEVFMQKPLDGQSGHDVTKRHREEIVNIEKALEQWRADGFMLEEVIVEEASLAAYNPDSLNTIRVCTIRDKNCNYEVINAAFRMGRKGCCVDNFDGGGIAAKIDFDSGKVVAPAVNGRGQCYEYHPDSGLRIVGLVIPKWNEIKEAALLCARKLPGNCVAWDFCVNSRGEVTMIEANSAPSIDFMQLTEGHGFASILKRGIRE